jgi:hypothetical protein
MLIQARWDEMRAKMHTVKDVYVSRHYTQCAKDGERMLAEVQGEVSATNVPHDYNKHRLTSADSPNPFSLSQLLYSTVP